MASLLSKIFWKDQPHLEDTAKKVSIIGAGMVGMAVAVSLLGTKTTRNLVLVDAFGQAVKGEVMDLQHAALFLKHPRISGGNDFSATAGSKLCIITAGVSPEPGESKLGHAQRNADIVTKLVPEIVKYSPDTLILMVGHPSDIMAYVAWKASGLPAHRVIGAGTNIDTARFKVQLAKKFNVNPKNLHAWIVGEHGDHSVALWSSVNICGLHLRQINPDFATEDDTENWTEIHKEVIEAGRAIYELKGYNNWGVGMSVATIAKALLTNRFAIHSVSVNAKGRFGIEEDIFIPLPAVLGSNGVTDVIRLALDDKEARALLKTARLLKELQDSIKMTGKEIKCKCRRCV